MRVVFLCEGTSDEGIAYHVERIAAECGVSIVLTTPDFRLLPGSLERTVAGKLRAAKELGGDYDLAVIHRDADRDGRQARLEEIRRGLQEAWPSLSFVAAIPVTMMEAWLMLDEVSIRKVAENPKGSMQLSLPKASNVERIADPKAQLKETLARASGLSGRRLRDFQARFSQHRRRLLELLDHNGPIDNVASWMTFKSDLQNEFRNYNQ